MSGSKGMNYSRDELEEMGYGKIGCDVQISRQAMFIGAEHVFIGDHVRIDAQCIISAGPEGVHIGNYVHISFNVIIFGVAARVVLEDFSGLAARTTLYTSTDDYAGGTLTNPTIPPEYRNIISGPVAIRKHAIIGNGAIIMPGVTIGRAAAVGAQSYVRKDIDEFAVVYGNPLRTIARRDSAILEREKEFLADMASRADRAGFLVNGIDPA